MLVIQRERSRLWACPEFYELIYYLAVVKVTLASILYIKEMVIPPLSLFVGHWYLRHQDTE